MTNLEVGDLVLCTVDKIDKTLVFVNIEGNGQGSIILSEIAPGRIRNLRDYVVPKKKIVCKILRVNASGNIELSLRRVTQKERKEVMERYDQEKGYISILKTVLKEKAEKAIEKIKEKGKIYDFLQEAKQNSSELERITGKAESEKVLEILKTQKQKKGVIKKEFSLTTANQNGLEIIKKILNIKDAEIKYIAAGRYSIKIEDSEIKKADNKLRDIIENIEKGAKKEGVEFSVREK